MFFCWPKILPVWKIIRSLRHISDEDGEPQNVDKIIASLFVVQFLGRYMTSTSNVHEKYIGCNAIIHTYHLNVNYHYLQIFYHHPVALGGAPRFHTEVLAKLRGARVVWYALPCARKWCRASIARRPAVLWPDFSDLVGWNEWSFQIWGMFCGFFCLEDYRLNFLTLGISFSKLEPPCIKFLKAIGFRKMFKILKDHFGVFYKVGPYQL